MTEFSRNPLLDIPAADPTLVQFGERYYLYPTYSKDGIGFSTYSSTDLSDFRDEGMILDFKDLTWAKKDAWAPDIIERNGRYYFYFSAESAIGVAVSDSPTGPFTDPLGKPLIAFEEDMSTIDPCVFIDDDGRTYLYWGATFYGKMFMRELAPDMLSFIGEKKVVFEYSWEKDYHCEGSFVFKRNGLYYYLWSEYIWCDLPKLSRDQSYRVNYAVSTSPEGPFTKDLSRVPLLSSDAALGFFGPGHNSVLKVPGEDIYYVIYHWHQGDATRRKANIDRLLIGPDGVLYPVRMTKEGVERREIKVWLVYETIGKATVGLEKRFAIGTRLLENEIASVTLYANERAVFEGPYQQTMAFTPDRAGLYQVYAVLTDMVGNRHTTKALHVDAEEAVCSEKP